MKKLLLLLFVSTLFFACDKEDKSRLGEIENAIIGTWKYEQIVYGCTTTPGEPIINDKCGAVRIYTFNSDLTYDQESYNYWNDEKYPSNYFNGTYEINQEKKTILLNGEWSREITYLTDKKMTLKRIDEYDEDGNPIYIYDDYFRQH